MESNPQAIRGVLYKDRQIVHPQNDGRQGTACSGGSVGRFACDCLDFRGGGGVTS